MAPSQLVLVKPRNPAVFIDKDGTLVENLPYNVDPSLIELAPGAAPALASLKQLGFMLFVVTNQPGIAEGRYPETALTDVHQRINELLRPAGAALDGFYYCPHPAVCGTPRCSCRKPMPGMLIRASQEHQLDLSRSWMIGDILDDVEAGRAAWVSTILVVNGGETEWKLRASRLPHYSASGIQDACRLIERTERYRHYRYTEYDGLMGQEDGRPVV